MSQLDFDIDYAYRRARELLRAGDNVEASDAFCFLTVSRPRQWEFWYGLGMAEQSLRKYEQAIAAYSMAMLLQPREAALYYNAAKCFYVLEDFNSAKTALTTASELQSESREIGKLARESLTFLKKLGK